MALTCEHGLREIVVSLSVAYLVTREIYGYIRSSYVAFVIRIGQRKVKDIECLVALFYVCLRTDPFEFVE